MQDIPREVRFLFSGESRLIDTFTVGYSAVRNEETGEIIPLVMLRFDLGVVSVDNLVKDFVLPAEIAMNLGSVLLAKAGVSCFAAGAQP